LSELEDLYREVILDHSRRRVGEGEPAGLPFTHHELNPSCGDEITLGIRVDEGRLATLAWAGQGCSISMASASVLAELVAGASVADATAQIGRFRELLRSRGDAEPPDELGDAAAFQGVARYVMRVKCAMLAWVALEACLAQAAAGAE